MGKLSAEVREIMGEDGPMARRLENYERRVGQECLAEKISEALESGGIVVAEAGTGIGKSFAYLLPAILWAAQSGKQVVVSTRTKALQEQLDRKDLPFLQAVLPIEFTWTLAVGRNNYICKRRLERAERETRTLFQDLELREQLAAIRRHAVRGDVFGTRNELDFVPEQRVWEEVQAEHGNCLGKKCSFFASCHWQKARRRLETAQILVVNHALYLADLSLRTQGAQLLPDHDCVIFDEAHHLEDIASDALGLRFSPGMVEWQASRLLSRDARRGLLAGRDKEFWTPLLVDLRARSEDYFRAVDAKLDGQDRALRLSDKEAVDDTISGALTELYQALYEEAGEPQGLDSRMELQSRARSLTALSEAAQAFARSGGAENVRWIEKERRSAVLRSSPISVAEVLGEELFQKMPKAILVSATLGPPERGFEWLRSRLGITDASTLRIDSPFPYHKNVQLIVKDALPDPSAESRAFETESSDEILRLCLENEGRALVLCTSWRFLHACRDRIEGPLRDAGIEILAQGDAPLTQLVDRKRREPHTVLLGTDSLWEGVDIPGTAVTLLILARFPFQVPTHPLVRARIEAIERRGGSAFFEYSLPHAILRFKQGFGRLVRGHEDKGRVVILDPRARRKRYGRRFLEVLPACRPEFQEELDLQSPETMGGGEASGETC